MLNYFRGNKEKASMPKKHANFWFDNALRLK